MRAARAELVRPACGACGVCPVRLDCRIGRVGLPTARTRWLPRRPAGWRRRATPGRALRAVSRPESKVESDPALREASARRARGFTPRRASGVACARASPLSRVRRPGLRVSPGVRSPASRLPPRSRLPGAPAGPWSSTWGAPWTLWGGSPHGQVSRLVRVCALGLLHTSPGRCVRRRLFTFTSCFVSCWKERREAPEFEPPSPSVTVFRLGCFYYWFY
jgi:hypothetical protein